MKQTIKNAICCLSLFAALGVGFVAGQWRATLQARVDVLSGPYSDDYGPALEAIATAKEKLEAGDSEITAELDRAQFHIENAQRWARSFIDQEDEE